MVISSKSRVSRMQFPVESFRRVPLPQNSDSNQATYVAIVSVFDLPDLSEWRKINVRDAKLTGAVPKAIRRTLEEDPTSFVVRNRGLVLATERVHFDNTSSTLEVTFSVPSQHGLLDGGHTFEVIRSYLSDVERNDTSDELSAFVRVELLEGFNQDQIVDVVEARNTSNQVKDQSLLELQQKFDSIKDELKDQPFADKVAYKEFEIQQGTDEETGRRPKPIDIRDVVSLMTVFDRDSFGDDDHPVIAYNSKLACLRRFRDHPDRYGKLNPILVDVLNLWDKIHAELPEWYRSSKSEKGLGSKFGRFRGVKNLPADREMELYFIGETSPYLMPTAFKYPILAAMRALLEERNGRYVWSLSPFEALENGLGKQLADVVLTAASDFGSHTRLGKAGNVWDQCYNKAELWKLRQQAAASN